MQIEIGKYYKLRDGRILYQDNDSLSNLENAPEKYTIWLNIYPSRVGGAYASRRNANNNADPDRIACVEVTYTEGEGL